MYRLQEHSSCARREFIEGSACGIVNVAVGRDRVIPSGVSSSKLRYASEPREMVNLSDADTSARDFEVAIHSFKLGISETLRNIDAKLKHLGFSQRSEVLSLIKEYSDLFPDVPGRAKGMHYDVDVGDAKPVK